MGDIFNKLLKVSLCGILVFEVTGCGTLLYPERRGQKAGHVDVGVAILDGLGLLLFLIPGIIAFAVDFSNGTIYLPAGPLSQMREIKFDPKHTDMAGIEKIIKDQTGYAMKLNQSNVKVARLKSKDEMVQRFAQAESEINTRVALAD